MRLFCILLSLLAFQGCGTKLHKDIEPTKQTHPSSNSLSARKVSIDPKIGQRFIVGFYGTNIERARIQLEPYIRDYRIGGVILFGRHSVDNITEDEKVRKDELFPGNISNDPQALKDLIQAIQDLNTEHSGIPLFIGIDQEGGLISRLRNCGLGETLSHEALGKEGLSKTTEEASKIAEYLKQLGCNLNFAPVVDLALNPENTVIVKNERSFGADPDRVAAHAKAYIEAHAKAGILCCLKHFPGHGSTTQDTHQGFTDASETFQEIELEPYKALISQGVVDCIMASHVYNKNFDTVYPASLSKETLTDLLKDKLGYKGLIMSDDLEMKALLKYYTHEEIIALSAKAGVDIFIIGNHDARREGVERSIQELQRLYNSGEISKEALDGSYQGILNLKQKLCP
jgi:beta-N-acetylhexosaminidase